MKIFSRCKKCEDEFVERLKVSVLVLISSSLLNIGQSNAAFGSATCESDPQSLMTSNIQDIADVLKFQNAVEARKLKNPPLDEFDSFFLADVTSLPQKAPGEAKTFESNFSAASLSMPIEQYQKAANILMESFGLNGRTKPKTLEDMRNLIATEGASLSRESKLLLISMFGSYLGGQYDLSGKNASAEEIFKNGGGGQCTEIHNFISRNVAASLGYEVADISGLLWGKGDKAALHGDSILRDPKTGEYIYVNYSGIYSIKSKSLTDAIEFATTYEAAGSNALFVETDPGRVHQFMPRTFQWWTQKIKGAVREPKDSVKIRMATGSAQQTDVSGRYGNIVWGYSKDGAYEISYAGYSTQENHGFAGDRGKVHVETFLGASQTVTPDMSTGKKDARTGITFHEQAELTYKLDKKTQLETGGEFTLVGARPEMGEMNSRSTSINIPAPYNQFHVGISQKQLDKNGKEIGRTGFYRVLSVVPRTLQPGDMSLKNSAFDTYDEIKHHGTSGKLSYDADVIFGGGVGSGEGVGVAAGGDYKTGGLEFSARGSKFNGKDPFYQADDVAWRVAATATMKLSRDTIVTAGVQQSNRSEHPYFRKDTEPGYGSGGLQMVVGVSTKFSSGSNPKSADKHSFTIEGEKLNAMRTPISISRLDEKGKPQLVEFTMIGDPKSPREFEDKKGRKFKTEAELRKANGW